MNYLRAKAGLFQSDVQSPGPMIFKPPQAETVLEGFSKYHYDQLIVSPAGYALSLAYEFSNITGLFVRNIGTLSTDIVDVQWRSIASTVQSSASAPTVFADTNPDTITRTAADFLGDVGYGDLRSARVYIRSAEDAANNTSFLIQAATATSLTLHNNAALTANADDTSALLTLCYDNRQSLDRYGFLHVIGDIYPYEIIFYASATLQNVEVLIVGD